MGVAKAVKEGVPTAASGEALATVGKPWGAMNSDAKQVKKDAVDDPGVCRNTLRDFSYFFLDLTGVRNPFAARKTTAPNTAPLQKASNAVPALAIIIVTPITPQPFS